MITATYPPSANGVAISTKRTVMELRKLGHRVVLYGPKRIPVNDDPDYIEAPTIRTKLFGLFDYPIAFPLPIPLILRSLPPVQWDIIHVHHPVIAGPFAIRLGRRLHVPVVFTYHTRHDQFIEHFISMPAYIREKMRSWMFRDNWAFAFQSFDGIIATTRWLSVLLKKRISKTDIYYGSTAGLSHTFFVRASRAALRRKLNLPVSGPLFLSVSRLSKEKHTEILIHGFLGWADMHPKGDLVIVGDGGNRAYLEGIVRESAHRKRVHFIGKIPNEQLPSWYSTADIFLYSSITDTIGINILEAMSAGLPVVAPDHATTREIIVSGTNGVLYKGDESHMAKAIDTALSTRHVLSRNARITAKQYNISRTIRDVVSIYEQIIRRYKKRFT